MAQFVAYYFGSSTTHVQGAPKLSGHLAGQQSPGDKVMALDQVHCWTANFDNRCDNSGTCYIMVHDSSEQVDSIPVGDDILKTSSCILATLG